MKYSSPKLSRVLFILCLLIVLSTQSAQAYLDPGTGSYIAQIAIASLLGIGFFIKTFWLSIKAFLMKLLKKIPEESIEKDDK